MRRKSWEHRGCKVTPKTLDKPILAACDRINRYLRHVWLITFPDQTFIYSGSKGRCRSYIDAKIHAHNV